MKKLKLKANAFQGNALSREQLKKVLGGVTGSGGCGIKINGQWHTVDGGRAEAEGSLGTTGSWNNGTVTGTVTNWCCDSCYWNQ